MRADVLFYNGNFSVSPFDQRKINWLAVRDGWICALGAGAPDRHLLVQKKIDLNRKRVVPGWIDAHVHLMLLGQRKFEVDVSPCRSPDELKSALKKALGRKKDRVRKGWLEAYGFDPERWKEFCPLTARILDQISSRISILVRRKDEHAMWANSCLLKKARLHQSHPTGYLADQDMDVIFRHRPQLSFQKVKEALLYAMQACIREGITSVHDMAMQRLPLEVLIELMRSKKYDLRVYGALFGEEALEEFPIPQVNLFHHHLTIRAQKLFIDGALGSRGAWLSQPYGDMPQWAGDSLWQEKELLERVRSAFQKRFQLIFHTLGDQASLWLLQVLASKYTPQELHHKRIRLEHVEVLNREALSLMKRLGVIASMQPWHALSDGPGLESRLGRVGDPMPRLSPINLCGESTRPRQEENSASAFERRSICIL
ncbi:MAG: amidohydrolase family protein [Deltaproteobacteria bacterium]|nr:amidohydrolase family protein [Deltaproteobacteria bacterium]